MGDENTKRIFIKKIEYILAVLLTVVVAIFVGCVMAMWDLEKVPGDILCIMNGTYVAMSVEKAANQSADNRMNYNMVENDIGDAADIQAQEDNIKASDMVGDESIKDNTMADVEKEISGEIGEIPDAHDAGNASESTVDADDLRVELSPDSSYPFGFSDVTDDYFADALFIGDSRMEGLGLYSGLPATFYAATGFQLHQYETFKVAKTEEGKKPIFDAIQYNVFSKIYIKVGLNEMGCSTDSEFVAKYKELINRLRAVEPSAIIFIHGLLPVTNSKNASDSTHSNAHIYARNELLKRLAEDENAYYLDVASALATSDGSLAEEMTGDGIHLKAKYIPLWTDYLRSHGIVVNH